MYRTYKLRDRLGGKVYVVINGATGKIISTYKTRTAAELEAKRLNNATPTPITPDVIQSPT